MTAAEELEKLYEAAERKLVEIIARKASAGSAVAYERQILKQVSAELKKLRRATPELVRQMVLSGYRTGLEGAVEDILKVDPSLPRSYNLFSRVNTRQIDLIVQNTADSLTKATRIVGRRIEDEIRAAGLRASALKEATGGTVGDMQKDLEKRLLGLDLRQANGKIGVRYKNGKVVSLKDYSKMVARTTTAEAQNKAKIVQAEEWGYDLAECTTHAPTCEVCAMYQGRAYALTKDLAGSRCASPTFTTQPLSTAMKPFIQTAGTVLLLSRHGPIQKRNWRNYPGIACSLSGTPAATRSARRTPRSRPSTGQGTPTAGNGKRTGAPSRTRPMPGFQISGALSRQIPSGIRS